MSNFKLLVDTNIVIALEDPQPVQASLAELVRLSGEHGVGLFVDGANYDDVARDRDKSRRQITLSKLDKFQKLRGIPSPDQATLVARFGAINSENEHGTALSWETKPWRRRQHRLTSGNQLTRRIQTPHTNRHGLLFAGEERRARPYIFQARP
jgi:hypothetical protein